ncbi:MAG: CpaE family protein [Nitrospinota bacterium]
MAQARLLNALLVDPGGRILPELKVQLEELNLLPVVGEAADLNDGFVLASSARPGVVLLHLGDEAPEALQMAERIIKNLPGTAVLALASRDALKNPELLLSAMRAGVRELLTFPLEEDEFRSAIHRLEMWRAGVEEGGRKGKVFTVFSGQGGSGSTTLATNLAVVLARHLRQLTVITDLSLQMGNVSLFLNVNPLFTIADVAGESAETDAGVLDSLLLRHPTGLRVLAEPREVEDADRVTADSVGNILDTLRKMFDFVVVDTPHFFNDVSLRAMDGSDKVLLVTTLLMPALRDTKRCLEIFSKLGYGKDKVSLVVNRFVPDQEFPLDEVEKTLGYPISAQVPDDSQGVTTSINRGLTLWETDPRSPVSLALADLAVKLAGGEVAAAPAKRRRGLFSLLRSR